MDLDVFVSDGRMARIDEVLGNRTRNLVLLVEGIWDPHNIAACMRTAEGLGLQELHVIGDRKTWSPHPKIVKGGAKWMDVFMHASPAEGAAALRKRGFRIYSGALSPTAVPIQSLDFTGPVALVFGNEHLGLTREMMDLSDETFYIPMNGFTQSFNISVAAGIGLFYAVERRVALLGKNGDLSDEDRRGLRERWIELSIPRVELLKKELRAREGGDPA